jgi:hypothetical protein
MRFKPCPVLIIMRGGGGITKLLFGTLAGPGGVAAFTNN